MITDYDAQGRRCPLLGHDIQFSYCRAPGSDVPCRKIYDCWWETFDIKAFMEHNYDAETIRKVLAPPKPKAASLLDLIAQAQKNAQKKKSQS